MEYQKKKLFYQNPLACLKDVEGFVLEGQAEISFPDGRLRIRNTMDESEGQAANIVYWCNQEFPDRVELSWDFYPISAKGLCVFFFSAGGRHGEGIFDSSLSVRTGEYQMYHSGDINAYHISYYRRMYESERAFLVANLRKSYGFHLVAQGADPIPYPPDACPPYHIRVIKYENTIRFYINDLLIFQYLDDGTAYGEILTKGMAGFRQMAPMIGEYSNFQVYELDKKQDFGRKEGT